MPATRKDHVLYTRRELSSYRYYVKMIDILRENRIESYIDIGSNTGEFCNVLFERIPSLKTAHLIEPEPDNFAFMIGNVKRNVVKFYNLAIGYGYKNAELICHPSKNVGGFFLSETYPHQSGIRVEISTLESLKIPTVDFIKIDIEGGEFNLIENSTKIKETKYIEIEFHVSPRDSHKNKDFLSKNLPNFDIICRDDTSKELERCLLGMSAI